MVVVDLLQCFFRRNPQAVGNFFGAGERGLARGEGGEIEASVEADGKKFRRDAVREVNRAGEIAE